MVITSEAQAALTPAGNPVAAPIPVTPVVVWVILVKAVFIQSVGVEDAVPTLNSGLADVGVEDVAESAVHPFELL
jgi:hypothetical protein